MSRRGQRHEQERNGPSSRALPHQAGAASRLDAYAMVDVARPPIPARSRLYALPLCGVGTAQVESITSYTARLAQAHGLTVRQLIDGEIQPQFGSPEGPKGGRYLAASLCKEDARALCGVRGWAAQWVTALEGLTHRADLCFATLLPWANVLSHIDLVRRERAWCPDCYQVCQDTHQAVYDQLLWSIQEVALCPCHRQPLHTHCPNGRCGKAQPYLASRLRPGYCAACGAWLGAAAASPAKPTMNEAVKWQMWVAEAVGELLASAPKLTVLPQRERLVYATTLSVEKMTGHNLRALARLIGRHESVLAGLVAGKSPVVLITLLRLCYVGGVQPLQFLTQAPLALKPRRVPTGQQPLFQKKRVRLARHDDRAYRQALEQVLRRQAPPPPSMRAMGRRLGCDPHYLYRRFPELCKAIARRYLAFRAVEKVKRLEQIQARVRAAVIAVHQRGLFPSRHRVGIYLNVHRFWSDRTIGEAWHAAVEALGLLSPDSTTMKP